MNKAVTSILIGAIAVCLLITLIVPKSLMAPYAINVLTVAIVVLTALSVFELIFVFVKTTPNSIWKPENSDQAEGRLHRGDPGEED